MLFFFFLSDSFPPSFWSAPNPHEHLKAEQAKLDKTSSTVLSLRDQVAQLTTEKAGHSQTLLSLKPEVTALEQRVSVAKARKEHLEREEQKQLAENRKLQSSLDGLVADSKKIEERKDAVLKTADETKKLLDEANLELAQRQEDVKVVETLVDSHTSELQLSQRALQDVRKQLHGSYDDSTHSLACLGAIVLKQPALMLEQVQLAVGQCFSLVLGFLLCVISHFSCEIFHFLLCLNSLFLFFFQFSQFSHKSIYATQF